MQWKSCLNKLNCLITLAVKSHITFESLFNTRKTRKINYLQLMNLQICYMCNERKNTEHKENKICLLEKHIKIFYRYFVLISAINFRFACSSVAAASYRGPGEDEDKNSYAARIAFTGNSRILGPICIVVGALMLALGVLLCMLTRRARRRERRVGFHCPLHGDFYPLSPVQGIKMLGKSN